MLSQRTGFGHLAVAFGVAWVLTYACGVAQAAPAPEAGRIISETGVKGGLIVHVGCGDGILIGRERVNFNILHTGVRVLKLTMPKGVSILEVYGDRVRDWRVTGAELTVALASEVIGDDALNVTYEQAGMPETAAGSRLASGGESVAPPTAGPTVADLVAQLKDPDAKVRLAAAGGLARYAAGMRRSTVSGAALPLPAAFSARYAAGMRGSTVSGDAPPLPAAFKEAVPALAAALKDTDAGVRLHAVYALGHLGDARAVAPLEGLLRDRDAWVRRNVVAALGEIGDARAREPLVAALRDAEPEVRLMAASSLGRLGDVRAVPALVAATKDVEFIVREEAAWALGRLGGKPATEALAGLLKDRDVWMRFNAATALAEAKDPRGAAALVDLMKVPAAQAHGPPKTGASARAFSLDADVRVEAAWALGRVDDERAQAALLAAARHPDERLRGAALEALAGGQRGGGSQADAALKYRMRAPVTIQFHDARLEEVLRFVGDVGKVNVHAKWRALEAAGIRRDSPVTLSVKDVPLGSLLQLALADAGNGAATRWAPMGGVAVASTRDDLAATAKAGIPSGPPFDQPINAEFAIVELRDVLKYVTEVWKVKFDVAWDGLRAAGVEPTSTVSVRLKAVSIGMLLRLVLDDAAGTGRAAIAAKDGKVVIRPADK